MFGLPITGSDVGELASNGSPALLRMAARVFGLGTAEQDALMDGKFPAWLWIALGLAAGGYAGVQLQRHYPRQVDRIMGGK